MRYWTTQPLVGAIVTACLGLSSLALAQDDPDAQADHDEAVRLFQMGELQYAGDEFADAASSFSRAYALEPNAVLALNAALAYENSGDLAEAQRYFELVLENSPDAGVADQANRGLSRINAILANIEANAPTIGTLALTTQPEGATVTVGEETLGAAPVEVELDPGTYTVEVTLEGYVPYTAEIDVEADETVRLVVPLTQSTPETQEEAWTTVVEPGASLVPTYAMAGGAVMAGALGWYFQQQAGWAWQSLYDMDAEVYREDDPEAVSDWGRQQATLSYASFGVAGALGVGAIAYTFLRRGPVERQVPVTVAPTASGAVVHVRF